MLFNIWVTTACNLQCRYCYEGKQENTSCMSIDVANDVIEYIIKRTKKVDTNEYIVVNYHGGEPLLNFPMIQFITDELKKTNN